MTFRMLAYLQSQSKARVILIASKAICTFLTVLVLQHRWPCFTKPRVIDLLISFVATYCENPASSGSYFKHFQAIKVL